MPRSAARSAATPGVLDVGRLFQTDANQVAAQSVGDVERRSDVVEAVGTVVVVKGHVRVSRHHRNDKTGPLDF